MSEYPLWNGTVAVEKMEDGHLANALHRSVEITKEIEHELAMIDEWKTEQIDKLQDRLEEWGGWVEILAKETQEREALLDEF